MQGRIVDGCLGYSHRCLSYRCGEGRRHRPYIRSESPLALMAFLVKRYVIAPLVENPSAIYNDHVHDELSGEDLPSATQLNYAARA